MNFITLLPSTPLVNLNEGKSFLSPEVTPAAFVRLRVLLNTSKKLSSFSGDLGFVFTTIGNLLIGSPSLRSTITASLAIVSFFFFQTGKSGRSGTALISY